LSACAALLAPQRADAAQATDYEVKAAFLLNFTKFVDWPAGAFAGPAAPITICILGKDPFGQTLDEIVEGEAVNGRPLQVRRIEGPPARQACQVVYVGGGTNDLPRTLGSLGPGVLTVGDGETFTRDGGMIAFALVNRRVRFDVNLTAAENASIRLSSRLLSVARTVEK
jgi:hypothetical protein